MDRIECRAERKANRSQGGLHDRDRIEARVGQTWGRAGAAQSDSHGK